MGIVVCVVMLLGVLMLTHQPQMLWQKFLHKRGAKITKSVIRIALFLLGVWNAGWYGAVNFDDFWGKAALISGLFMIVASFLLMGEHAVFDKKSSRGKDIVLLSQIYEYLEQYRWLVVIGLAGSFLLYFVTLVRLNLGYPIIH